MHVLATSNAQTACVSSHDGLACMHLYLFQLNSCDGAIWCLRIAYRLIHISSKSMHRKKRVEPTPTNCVFVIVVFVIVLFVIGLFVIVLFVIVLSFYSSSFYSSSCYSSSFYSLSIYSSSFYRFIRHRFIRHRFIRHRSSCVIVCVRFLLVHWCVSSCGV